MWITEDAYLKDIYYPYVLKNNGLSGFGVRYKDENSSFELVDVVPVQKKFGVPQEIVTIKFYKTREELVESFEDYPLPNTSDNQVNDYLEEYYSYYSNFFSTWQDSGPGTAENLITGTSFDTMFTNMPTKKIKSLPNAEFEAVKDYFLTTENLNRNLKYIVNEY